MLINGYDFDGTIYRGDSSVDFYLYCRNKYPRVKRDVFCVLPLLAALILHKKDLTREKEHFYRYLSYVPDAAAEAERFWEGCGGYIKAWYLKQKRQDDLIISASPEFLLNPICKTLGVRLIASKVDPKTGKYDGLNCHDEEKVRRLREAYPDAEIDRFYSDSRADTPLTKLAKQAFLVKGDVISPFPLKHRSRNRHQ
ncbi:MAG: haloacid dehalogenase-like hydrolase [Clostridiaceae bacterium]